MNNPFKELTIDKLNDCEFVDDVNAKLEEAVQSVMDYNKKYSLGAKKAKAVLTVVIEVESVPSKPRPGQGEMEFSWGLSTKIDTKKPKDHPVCTNAISVQDDDGNAKLFVQASGSFAGDPRQMRFTTEDGRQIDLDTGEIVGSNREMSPVNTSA